MLQSINDFINSIDALLSHIEFENERNIFFQSGQKKYIGDSYFEKEFRKFVESKMNPSLINSRTFIYNNALITLYGCLENYLEQIVKEYITIIGSSCNQYKLLPTNIRKHHLNVSIELLNKIQKGRGINSVYRDKILKETVRNMHSCLQGDENFCINSQAFTLHTANFRYDTVHSLFQKIGIDGISRLCLENSEFANDLLFKHSIDFNVSKKTLISLLIAELDDLAQKRNEIAHGVKTDEIESLELLRSRILLIKSYGKAINKVVSNFLKNFLFSICEKVGLGKPVRVFQKIDVFGFIPADNVGKGEIAVGDTFYAENQASITKIVSGEILSIKKGDISLEKMLLPSNEPFSIGVNIKVSKHMKKRQIYIVKMV